MCSGSEDENMIDLCTSEEGSGDEEEDEEGCGEEESEEEEEEEEEEEKNSVAADDSDFDPEGESDDENMTAGVCCRDAEQPCASKAAMLSS